MLRYCLQAGREFEPAHRVVPELIVERSGEQRILAYSLTRFDDSSGGRSGAVLVLRDVAIERAFNKMRSEFVLRASHELRTPVTSIRMGLGILKEKLNFPAGSRERELYDTVQAELHRMVSLLTDLLDLSRLQTGSQVLERLPLDIPELLTRAQQRFSLQAANAGIELVLELESSLPSVSLDRTQFDRALDNLISNALRHTPEGGSIALIGRMASDHVAIGVTDTGEGIPPVQHALIFQPFVQVGKRRGGAGLGWGSQSARKSCSSMAVRYKWLPCGARKPRLPYCYRDRVRLLSIKNCDRNRKMRYLYTTVQSPRRNTNTLLEGAMYSLKLHVSTQIF